jgi:hypothetical protein
MKKPAVLTLLMGLLYRVHQALFRYQVRTGIILCVVEGEEETVEGETGEEETGTAAGTEEEPEDEVVVSIGDESPPSEEEEAAHAPEWVRELRKNHRDLVKRNRELEEQVKAKTEPATAAPTLGAKPTLEACDYDAEAFETALTKWYEQKRQVDEQKAKAEADAKAQADAWNAKLASYADAKTKLKVKDFEEAESTAQSALNPTQQGIILQGAEKPEMLIYALGKNPTKLKELSAITDPVKYAFAVAKLETQLKVTLRKAPPPEKVVQGTGPKSGTVDSTLERLRAEAEKTGNYTKVMEYKRSKRQA